MGWVQAKTWEKAVKKWVKRRLGDVNIGNDVGLVGDALLIRAIGNVYAFGLSCEEVLQRRRSTTIKPVYSYGSIVQICRVFGAIEPGT